MYLLLLQIHHRYDADMHHNTLNEYQNKLHRHTCNCYSKKSVL
jgi:hypothetical protein